MARETNNRAESAADFADIEVRAVAMVRHAGQMALERFHQPLQVEFKRDNKSDPVTEADRSIEGYLKETITREFPGHAILGEEGTEVEVADKEFVWVLDPVDGTTNFLNGLPLFGCSAGLLRRGEPVVGAMFLPVAPRAPRRWSVAGAQGDAAAGTLGVGGAVIHARLGGGTYLDGEPVRASDAPEPEPSSLTGLPGHHFHQFLRLGRLRGNPGELRSLGSVCYETAMVATGVFRYAVFRGPKVWDMAAGTLIVKEAGGQVLVWRDGSWTPLVRFEPMINPRKPEEKGLRFWRGTTLVAGGRVATSVVQGLRPRGLGLTRLAERFFRDTLAPILSRNSRGSDPSEGPKP